MSKKRMGWCGALAMLTFLAGCQTPSSWERATNREIDANLERARTEAGGAQKPPAEISQALLPPMEITLPEGKTAPIEPRFDLTVSNAPARQVFMGLVEGTKYGIIVPPDVSGTVSLNLKEVTVPEALDAIRDVYGYEYKREGNRFLIYGHGLRTRIFTVNYLDLVRTGKSDTRVASGGIGTISSSGTGVAAGTVTTLQKPAVELNTRAEMDFWKDLTTALTSIVGTEGGRKVVVNPQTGVVVVRAMPDELRLVENYLRDTHRSADRQVVLEAKIIEVDLNNNFQAGINWSAIGTSGGRQITAAQIGGGSNNLSTSGATDIAGAIGTLRPGTGTFDATGGTATSAFGGVFTLAAVGHEFTAFLELLQAQGNVQVLSSPRVSTVNNQKAVIKVGGDEFFVTGVGTNLATTLAGVTTTSTPTVQLTSFFSGIVLDVTPQIDDSGNILLHIHPSVSDISQENKTFSVAGQTFSLPLALSSIQESDNVVRAQSGQVIVIGGLMKEGSTNEDDAVPILGDIPVVGNLFKQKKITRIKKELVILLKPTVVNSARDWDDQVRDSQERVKKIRIGS